ncbi:MAG: hypothetical protein HQL90_12125 [Magnetococcales bacterium]|nr:hypothetical protein [Magnetococcales bacterium]
MIDHRPRRPDLSDAEYSVVLIGDFNPKIYQPAWFASQELLRASEADNANIEVVHANLTSFSTEWFTMQVIRDKFSVTIKSPVYLTHLKNLVLGTFRLLSHTPLRQMGINYTARIQFKDALDWHCFGHFMLPKSPWTGLLSNPGMRAVSVESARKDDMTGWVVINVTPVQGVANKAEILVNDHCECPHDRQSDSTGFFLEIIEREYGPVLDRSKALVEKVVNRFCEQSKFEDGEVARHE